MLYEFCIIIKRGKLFNAVMCLIMRFSVIVPIYNVEKYLSQCIESILKQTYRKFELILVIDGSEDGSADVCKNYAIIDSRIHVIAQENKGLVAARKRGAGIANGDYIICIDGDDYVHPNLLSKISEQIDKYPSIDMICYGYYEENPSGLLVPNSQNIKEGKYDNIDYLLENYMYSRLLKKDNNGLLKYPLWTKCVKTDIYFECQDIVPNNIKNGEDILCSAWILSKIKTYSIMDFLGYYYRYNTTSLTHQRTTYDLVNISNVKNELERISCYLHENIGHYYLSSIYILLRDMARISSNKKDFLEMTKYLLFDSNYNDLRFYIKYGIKDIIRYSLVQKQKWKLLYYIVKIVRI